MKGYIIGNGFDLSHGMKTRFTDFYKYVSKMNPRNVDCFRYFYNIDDLWGNFEDNIGKIDYEFYMAHMGSIYDERDEYGLTVCADDIDFDHLLCDYQELEKDLLTWIKSLKMPTKKYDLSSDALFLSFNYSTVLEDVYSIKKKNILHIHGNILSGKLITGYDNINITKVLNGADRGIYTWEFPYEYTGYQILENYLSSFYKDTNSILQANIGFLNQFEKCDEIFILGLSFSKTDKKYLEYILECINKSAKINISYFSHSDRMRISWFLRKKTIENAHINKIEHILRLHSN